MVFSSTGGPMWMLALVPLASTTPHADYPATVARLQATRSQLEARWSAGTDTEREAIVVEARSVLHDTIVDALIPAWQGTPWDFHGTSETPGSGTIACGFYVSTILRDAGFDVERINLGRQASENIIRTVSPAPAMWRRSGVSATESVAGAADGLYIAGLDQHTGFVVVEDGQARFCDASYVAPAAVTCQPVDQAASFASTYRVFGPVLADEAVERWLHGAPFPTVGRSP